jgi:hypothetical protein
MPIAQADKEKIAHLNAERLFANYDAASKSKKLMAAARAFSKS